ncbi:MAG: nucleotide exchange factor GrpE [Jatrophihabitans sp.]
MSEQHEKEPVVIRDNRKVDREPSAGSPDGASAPPGGADAPGETPDENAILLDERTRDLQRLQAEYANYRKRSDRDRLAAGDLATGKVLGELLPILDDLDRAKAHGDLTGPLRAVADKLDGVFTKLGLIAFGVVGDPFDPALHEAVMHDESDAVSVPTCTTVLRQGYRHRDRLLRPAMVGVSDPALGAGPATVDATEDATAGAERHAAPEETVRPETTTQAQGKHEASDKRTDQTGDQPTPAQPHEDVPDA